MEGTTEGEHMEGTTKGGAHPLQRSTRSKTKIFFKRLVTKFLAVLSLGLLAVSFGLVMEFVAGVETPIVIMQSDVKECNITAGDTLFIHNRNATIKAGDIILSNVHGLKKPSLHRVIGVYDNPTSSEGPWFLTQRRAHVAWPSYTDENQLWLQRHHIIGRVFWSLPYVGHFFDFGALNESTSIHLAAISIMISTCLIYLKTKREDKYGRQN